MEHTHRALSKTGSHHVFDFPDSCELSAFTRLLELNLAGEKAPKDLRNELVVRVRLSSQDLLQDEQVMVRRYIIEYVSHKIDNLPSYFWVSNRSFE